ncbi:MAG: DUF1674 domain-containing protein [Novosphingobium sp.]
MIQRATKRPSAFTKPAHWSNDPAPQPAAPTTADGKQDGDHDGLSPTRYGDWVKSGIAVDF